MVHRFAPVGVQTWLLLPAGSGDVPVIAAVSPIQSRGSSTEDTASRTGGGAGLVTTSGMPSERLASASDRR
jgi:hypothetical protein